MCKERPAPLRIVPQVSRCSSCVILPNWCNETKSEGTSHWEWWTKHATKKRWRYGTSGNTNQDLVTGPRYIHNDSDSRQSELRSELVCRFITPAQTQNFNKGRNLSVDSMIGVHSTSLCDKDNDVFRKKVLSASHDQRSPHDSLPLSRYFCKTHGIPSMNQQFPALRL